MARSITGVRRTVREHFYVQTGFGKTIKNVINTLKFRYFGPLLRIPVVHGWVTEAAPDVHGKQHVHNALKFSFVVESRVRSR